MKTDLYIPKTITVGYERRPGTFTGKLAYVIYTDHKGKLRKEVSWNSWRDKSIEAITFDNTPHPNFTFNKGVERDGHWGSGRSMIRVWDPRDFELEIEVDNLIGILMHSDVSKRDIVEPCVYAWHGANLVLLPTNSIEYQESVTHTDKQAMKVGAKELGIGYTYEIKRDRGHVVYLGRFPTYEVEREYAGDHRTQIGTRQIDKKPQHAFYDLNQDRIEFKSPTQYLAQVVSEECHPRYAELLDTFYHLYSSQPMIGIASSPPKNVLERDFTLPTYWANYAPGQLAYYVERVALVPMTGTRWIKFADNMYIELDITFSLFKGGCGVAENDLPVQVKVAYTGAAVYDPDTRSVKYSTPERNKERYFYSGAYLPAVRLPEINETMPAVMARIAEVRNDLLAAVAGVKLRDSSNTELDDEVASVIHRVIDWGIKHSVGDLYVLLRDGKISSNSI